jgi:N-acetylglutamate synthase-like GNAT family acetyltransferase
MISIKLYEKDNQKEIDSMLDEIANEFELPISNGNKSTSHSLDKYWVAFNKTKIIGTVGVVCFDNNLSILKSMFVKKEYRGKNMGISSLLLHTVFDWCKTENIEHIYLGTMNQFKAAHSFYERNGFKQINKNKLPLNFRNNPIDDVFYLKSISI